MANLNEWYTSAFSLTVGFLLLSHWLNGKSLWLSNHRNLRISSGKWGTCCESRQCGTPLLVIKVTSNKLTNIKSSKLNENHWLFRTPEETNEHATVNLAWLRLSYVKTCVRPAWRSVRQTEQSARSDSILPSVNFAENIRSFLTVLFVCNIVLENVSWRPKLGQIGNYFAFYSWHFKLKFNRRGITRGR